MNEMMMAAIRLTTAEKVTAKTARSATSRPTTAKLIRSLTKRKTTSELAKVKQQFEIDAAAQDQFNRLTIKRLAKIRGDNVELIKQYRDHVYNLLQETYAVYCDIQNSDYKEDFYNDLRSALASKGISVRSDTTDAALTIRTVFPQFKPKQVYDYGCALMMGEHENVEKDKLAAYVKQKTITKLIENYKQTQADNDDGRARKLRACTVILRLIENKESQTLATFSERRRPAASSAGRADGRGTPVSRHRLTAPEVFHRVTARDGPPDCLLAARVSQEMNR